MSQGTYDLFWKDVRESSGLILYDPGQVTTKEDLNLNQIGIPATEWALKELKDKQAANIVLLGALVENGNRLSQSGPEGARRSLIPRFTDLNLKPSRIGWHSGGKGMVEGRTHRPVIHPETCHSCDICIRGCPGEIIPEYRSEEASLRGTLYKGR